MFVGITSAPRKIPTLAHTIECVRECGQEPRVFAEPGTSVPSSVKTIHNTSRLGIVKNWLSLCVHALDTESDLVITLQDDVDLHPDTLDFVIEHKGNIQGLLGLYTSRYYGRGKQPGVHHIKTRHLWGACALAFKKDTLATIINHPRISSWGRDTGIDVLIGNIVNELELPMHFICPSPASHIGKTSTVGHGGNEGNRNCAIQADKKIPLEKQIWPNFQLQQ